MINIHLSEGGIHNLSFSGTPSEMSGELAFSVCFVYGQLFSQDKEAAEEFRKAFMAVVTQPFAWRQLIPDSLEEDESEEREEPVIIDFVAELEKRKKKE